MSRLLEKTKELLASTDKNMAQICVDTGLTLGWLQTVKYGKGSKGPIMPTVDKIEKLYVYLSGKQLDL